MISPTTGLPLTDGVFSVNGDRNPDFTIGWNNQFRWKNWRLSMLWDMKVGGDIFNGTNLFLTIQGRSKLTEDRYKPRVVDGVLSDGLQNTSTPTINTIAVIPGYNESYYLNMPEEAFIEKNVHWFRMRDLSLSYTFKQNFIKGVKSMGFFVTANDLILLTNYSGADPAVNGNTASGRGVGGFGFDYGTLPAPISVNVGIRTSF